jgi:hypothetical protein
VYSITVLEPNEVAARMGSTSSMISLLIIDVCNDLSTNGSSLLCTPNDEDDDDGDGDDNRGSQSR